MKPINLSDDELAAVMAAAQPLRVRDRNQFLQAVAVALRDHGEPLGPGVVRKIAADVQHRFWGSPHPD